jgi:5-methylcytosine-specific restriction endonuclease McrA
MTKINRKEITHLCDCGCGNKVKWNKNKKEWNKFVRGHTYKGKIRYMKGSHHTKETREKLRIANTGKIFSEETKKKMSKVQTGVKKSEEAKKNMRKPKTKEHAKNISLGHTGEKSYLWKGGLTKKILYSQDWIETLKNIVRERDNYQCQICLIHQDELDRKLHVHHIDYNKKNCSEDNLISLCTSCHMKTNFKRKEWIKYFIIKENK